MTPVFIAKAPVGEEGLGVERQARSVPRLLYDGGSQDWELAGVAGSLRKGGGREDAEGLGVEGPPPPGLELWGQEPA